MSPETRRLLDAIASVGLSGWDLFDVLGRPGGDIYPAVREWFREGCPDLEDSREHRDASPPVPEKVRVGGDPPVGRIGMAYRWADHSGTMRLTVVMDEPTRLGKKIAEVYAPWGGPLIWRRA